MHPRTIAILVGSMLLAALGVRLFLFDSPLLPANPQTVLKQARSLTVSYSVQDKAKTLTINEGEELDNLLAVLRLRRGEFRGDDWNAGGGMNGLRQLALAIPAPTVTFHFPDGTRETLTFAAPHWLGPSEVDPRFYRMLCDLASRAEGRRVELFPNDVQLWNNGQGGPGMPGGPGFPGPQGGEGQPPFPGQPGVDPPPPDGAPQGGVPAPPP